MLNGNAGKDNVGKKMAVSEKNAVKDKSVKGKCEVAVGKGEGCEGKCDEECGVTEVGTGGGGIGGGGVGGASEGKGGEGEEHGE